MTNFSPKLFKSKTTGAIIFKHPCKTCGKPNASFGVGLKYKNFLKSHAEGKPNYKLLGEWTCGMSGCKTEMKGQQPNLGL